MNRIGAFVSFLCVFVAWHAFGMKLPDEVADARLERRLWELGHPNDNLDSCPAVEYVPQRQLDALKDFSALMRKNEWTTNQLIQALGANIIPCNVTHYADEDDKKLVSGMAFESLSMINNPLSYGIVKNACTSDAPVVLFAGLPGVFRYTNFEPEVMAYMRSVCVMTNRYDAISDFIAMRMEDTLADIPAEYKPSATTNFCKYLYFVIGHTTQQMCAQDRVLARLMPSYSNSVQRVQAMNYVVNTATNAYQRMAAQRELARLSQLPTNALNDVSWLTEE